MVLPCDINMAAAEQQCSCNQKPMMQAKSCYQKNANGSNRKNHCDTVCFLFYIESPGNPIYNQKQCVSCQIDQHCQHIWKPKLPYTQRQNIIAIDVYLPACSRKVTQPRSLT